MTDLDFFFLLCSSFKKLYCNIPKCYPDFSLITVSIGNKILCYLKQIGTLVPLVASFISLPEACQHSGCEDEAPASLIYDLWFSLL